MASVVILGAGLTGISAAYHLEREGFFDYVLFEKDTTSGGLCRSVTQDGFTFDYTGHLLHLSNAVLKERILSLVGDDFFQCIARQSLIYSHERYTNYPYQVNLHGLPHEVIVDCIEGFVKRELGDIDEGSFCDWVMKSFGAGFARHFFYPYQSKIFDISVEELSASWTKRFVPSTSLKAMLYGALGSVDTSVGYNAEFLYPRSGGIGAWVEKIAHALYKPILTGYEVTHVDTVARIVRCANGHEEPYEQLISTIPLDVLLMTLQEKSSLSVKQALPHLRCASIISFNIGLDRSEIVPAHWVYYPEQRYPFYRIGFPSRLTGTMAPTGCSSLAGETSFLQRSTEAVAGKIAESKMAVRTLFAIAESEIKTELIFTIPHAYVIFDRWRDQHLSSVLERLAQEQIHSVGRYGAWKYASMQDALLDGQEVAETVRRFCDRPLSKLSHPSVGSAL